MAFYFYGLSFIGSIMIVLAILDTIINRNNAK